MARTFPPWLKRVATSVPALLLGVAFLGTAASPLGLWSSHLERMSHFRFGWIVRGVNSDRMGSDHHPVIAVLAPAGGG